MEPQKFTRRPFHVYGVQVTPQNVKEVAEWCGGKIGQGTYKLAGFDTTLDIVLVPGNGPNKGELVEARIGSYITVHKGSFRVWRKKQFLETFVMPQALTQEPLRPEDLVEVVDPQNRYYGFQGEVEFVDQVCIDMPAVGGCMFNPHDLKRIDEYSDATMERIKEEARVAAVQTTQNMDVREKINAIRAAAEAAVGSSEISMPPVSGSLEEPPTSINGMEVGTPIVVRNELAEFFSDTGEVVKILDEATLLVQLDAMENGEKSDPVKFLHDEIQPLNTMKFVTVNNPDSDQNGWVGWVVQDAPTGDLIRVAFRSNILGRPDKCFSYMDYELEEYHLGTDMIPRYELPA